jgi:hypothetical protein
LNAKVTQLKAKVTRAEELELKIPQQQLLLNALQSCKSQNDETEMVRSSDGRDSALGQIAVSAMPSPARILTVKLIKVEKAKFSDQLELPRIDPTMSGPE